MVFIVYANPYIFQMFSNICHTEAPGTSEPPGDVATSLTGLIKAELKTVTKPYKIW